MHRPPPLIDRRPRRDNAPVIAAETLLRRGLTDARIGMHLVASWRLTERDAADAVAAAHVLLRREHFDSGTSRPPHPNLRP